MQNRARVSVARTGDEPESWFACAQAALIAACSLLFLIGCAGNAVREDGDSRIETTPAYLLHEKGRPLREGLSQTIDRIQARYAIPGLSLAVVKDGEVVWAEGFGVADQSTGAPASQETIYRVGSLAKPVTAMAVMQLEERGELDIDQPLHAYIPQFSIRSRFDTVAEPITLRSILCHHAGLPTDLNKGMWTGARFTEVAVNLRAEYAAFPPNLVFSYSNTGYSLLGTALENVSGMPYEAWVRTHIFQPLGMSASGFDQRLLPADRLAQGHKWGEAQSLLPIRDRPAFGLYTSAMDLGRFMAALLPGGEERLSGVIMPETLMEMFEPQNTDSPLDLNVRNGIGWFLEDDTIPGGGRVVRHGGTTLFFSSELIMLPERGWGVAVLSNSGDVRPVVAQLAEEVLRLAVSSRSPPTERERRIAAKAHLVEAHELSAPGGNYATDVGLISIRPKDAKLCACILEETFDLIPYPNGWFGIKGSMDSLPPAYRQLSELHFQTRVIEGREVIVAERNGKEQVLGEKIPPEPIPERWKQRVGRYELLNPDPGFPLIDPQVRIVDGQLCMSYKLPLLSESAIRVPLRPVSDSEAIILGLGRTRGETLRAVQVNGKEHLRYSGFVGRKID